MSFLTKLFKKKKEALKHEPEKATVQTPEESSKKETPGATGRIVIPGVLLAPRVSEKTANAAQENKYVFSVAATANKTAIKKAVQSRYGVRVEAVNINYTRGKERKRGRIVGRKPGFKKAIVTLKEGQKIEIQ